MKSTGIIRRIDDLGRIVIPREIRRTMHIHEGDPLEIFTDDGAVLLRKYNPVITVLDTLKSLASEIAETEDLKRRGELLQKLSEMRAILKEQENSDEEAAG